MAALNGGEAVKKRLCVVLASLAALASMQATGQQRPTNEQALRQFVGVWELTHGRRGTTGPVTETSSS
jgi:hypothetical protein